MRTAVASFLVTGVPLGGLRPSRRDGKPGLISGEARPLGPAPTLPVKAPVDALFGHRQHPRGHLITLWVHARWGAALCGHPVGHSLLIEDDHR
jgi:hypothetical protein